jgi:hypothetical protein
MELENISGDYSIWWRQVLYGMYALAPRARRTQTMTYQRSYVERTAHENQGALLHILTF